MISQDLYNILIVTAEDEETLELTKIVIEKLHSSKLFQLYSDHPKLLSDNLAAESEEKRVIIK